MCVNVGNSLREGFGGLDKPFSGVGKSLLGSGLLSHIVQGVSCNLGRLGGGSHRSIHSGLGRVDVVPSGCSTHPCCFSRLSRLSEGGFHDLGLPMVNVHLYTSSTGNDGRQDSDKPSGRRVLAAVVSGVLASDLWLNRGTLLLLTGFHWNWGWRL